MTATRSVWDVPCPAWRLHLRDGRTFCFARFDGVTSEEHARARVLAQEPGAEVVEVEQVRIVSSVELAMN